MRGVLERVVEVVFPARCVGCGNGGWPVCSGCADSVGVITPPICARCGRPVEQPVKRCADCPPGAISRARAPFLYHGPVVRAVRGMKFSGWSALAPHLAGAMVAAWDLAVPEAVTWVPLSRRRRARRGFDQAEVLALEVARRMEIPARRYLNRGKDTRAQARLSGPERRAALKGAFEPCGDPPRAVLLVDDVITTGATAASCADVLRQAGAGRVMLLAAARSLNRSVPPRIFGPGGPWKGADRTG